MEAIVLPNEVFPYSLAAREEARRAGVQANYGQRAKTAWYENSAMLRKWRELMVNAPILLHNALFLLFALADMILSWEMIRDVVVRSAIPPQIETLAVLVFCLLINAWAAVTAHFIGRGWSREVQDWERWNFIFVKNRSQTPVNLVSDEMRREVRRARFWAIFSGLILLGLIAVIIYYRNRLGVAPVEVDAEGEALMLPPDHSDRAVAIVLAYLPLAIILGELLTGDYFWYSLRRWQIGWAARRHRRQFLRAKEQCGVHDQLAVQYTQNAAARQEHLEIIGDLEKSHLRAKFRSQQNDDYLDPLEYIKRIGFTFRHRGSGAPVVGALVFGVLPNGAKTGDGRTDEQGKVTLHPDGDYDRLVAVYIDKREYLGPFQFNGEHYIDLPEAAEALVPASNGHG